MMGFVVLQNQFRMIILYLSFCGISEPENDVFEEVLCELRERLNWCATLPRHGQGCREKMEAISDEPSNVEVNNHNNNCLVASNYFILQLNFAFW